MTTISCANCGGEIAPAMAVNLVGNKKNPGATICADCARQIEGAFEAETQNPNVVGALLFGGGAGLIMSVVWSLIVVLTNYQVGIIAIAVGWIVATAAVFGAGRKRGGAVQAIAIVVTLFSMMLSEYAIVRHFAVEALATEGITGIPLLLPPGLAFELIVEGIRVDPMTLLFWAVALWAAFSIPRKRKLKKA